MKKVIVTTTIHPPTEAIQKFDQLKDWTLVVAGDLKTPTDYHLEQGIYISPTDQEAYHKELSDLIGWNSHARRNFALLWAKDLGADVIAIVDDDNIPMENWGKELRLDREVETNFYETDIEAFDPVGATNYPNLWHRGFPPELIHKRDYSKKSRKKVRVDIQADFWNGDPDVDALCRMRYAPNCVFDPACFPIASNRPSPFNSQNIFITKEILPKCFFLPHITPLGRMSDIWISYHLQSLGFQVVYFEPSVYQDRNEHDVVTDLNDEMLGYEKCLELVSEVNNGTYQKEFFWPERTLRAYEVFRQEASHIRSEASI